MATWTQLPGTLNLSMNKGDEFATVVDFSVALTGYTVTADIVSLVSGSTVDSFATSFVDASAGTINVGLTESQTSALGHGTYGWRLQWVAPGSSTRTALTGKLDVV